MKRRLQFSLRNALWAMFWASVWGGSHLALDRLDYTPSFFYDLFYLFLAVLVVVSPFMAVGALFGRPLIGLFVCGFIVLALALLTASFD